MHTIEELIKYYRGEDMDETAEAVPVCAAQLAALGMTEKEIVEFLEGLISSVSSDYGN